MHARIRCLTRLAIERDYFIPHALTIHLHPGKPPLAAFRIFDLNLVDRFTMTIAQRKPSHFPG